MTRTRWIEPFLAALLVLGAASAAQAALSVYTSRADFLAAVGEVGVDSFDDLSTLGSTPSPLSRTAGSHAYTAAAETQGFFGAGTAPDVWLSVDQFSDAITFGGFGAGVNAIGGLFFGSDLFGSALAGQSLQFDVTDSDGTQSFTLAAADVDSFRGWVSNATLLSLRVVAVQPDLLNSWPTVDDLVLAVADGTGTGVNEPASLALAMLALAAAGSGRRRACRAGFSTNRVGGWSLSRPDPRPGPPRPRGTAAPAAIACSA